MESAEDGEHMHTHTHYMKAHDFNSRIDDVRGELSGRQRRCCCRTVICIVAVGVVIAVDGSSAQRNVKNSHRFESVFRLFGETA